MGTDEGRETTYRERDREKKGLNSRESPTTLGPPFAYYVNIHDPLLSSLPDPTISQTALTLVFSRDGVSLKHNYDLRNTYLLCT
jgi:hypothetical protein